MSAAIMKPYVIVKFTEEKSVEVVPSSWISTDKLASKWPSKKYSADRITRLVMSLSKPDFKWNSYPVTVMYSYDKYQNAHTACKLAKDSNNLAAEETDLDKSGKICKPKHLDSYKLSDKSLNVQKRSNKEIYSDSDNDEDEIPHTKRIKKTVAKIVTPKKITLPSSTEINIPLLKQSSKSIIDLTKSFTNTNLSCSQMSNQNVTYSRNDIDNTEFNVYRKKATLSTISLSDSISASDKASTSLLTKKSLSENNSNADELILSNIEILNTDCDISEKISFTKTLLSETSASTINDQNCEILLKVLIEQIEEISGKLDHINMSFTRLYKKLSPEDPVLIKPRGLPQLPLKDEEAFHAFEQFLKNDDNFLATINYFVLLMPTGKVEKETIPVGKLLAKIFSNSLARIINYSRSGSVKIKLQDTNILTVIQCKF